MATVADPGIRVYYECCQVIAVTELVEPCWQCGEIAKAIPMVNLPKFHPTQRVWHLTSQTATRPHI